MTNPNDNKSRNDQFLDAIAEELQTMSDTDALEGESAEELVKLGKHLLETAREEAGKLRMNEARRKLSLVSGHRTSATLPSVAEAKKYLESHPKLTLAARNLNELSDTDVLDLYSQAQSLDDGSDANTKEDKKG